MAKELAKSSLAGNIAGETPLHVAVKLGDLNMVRDINRRLPEMCRKSDQHGFSPLHLASRYGNIEITRELVRSDPGTCLLVDDEGRTPLHMAAMTGRVKAINEILSVNPYSVRISTLKSQTVLHLAVKHGQFETVKELMRRPEAAQLLIMRDQDGNTILHLATAGKMPDIVSYLLNHGQIEVNALNLYGFTALDFVNLVPKDRIDEEISKILIKGGAKRSAGSKKMSSELKQKNQQHM